MLVGLGFIIVVSFDIHESMILYNLYAAFAVSATNEGISVVLSTCQNKVAVVYNSVRSLQRSIWL